MHLNLRSVYLCFLLAVLSGCGGGAGTALLTGVIFKGPIENAKIEAYTVSPNGELGEKVQVFEGGEKGSYTIDVDSSLFPLYLKVVGGTFTDEATGLENELSEENYLSTILYSVSIPDFIDKLFKDIQQYKYTIHITPLTTLAAELVLTLFKERQIILKNDLDYSFSTIAKRFNLKNLYEDAPADLTDEFEESASELSSQYGLVISGLSEQAKKISQDNDDSSIQVMTLVTALRRDISDGLFDGKYESTQTQEETQITLGDKKVPLSDTSTTTALTTGMKDFLKSEFNRSGFEEADEALTPLYEKLNESKKSLITVDLTPESISTVVGSGAISFSAKVSEPLKNEVTWSVNGISGGNETVGLISPSGVYTPPQSMSSASSALTIRATSTQMVKIYGEALLTLNHVMALNPLEPKIQIETSKTFTVTLHESFQGAELKWFINGIEGGSDEVGRLTVLNETSVQYVSPENPQTVTLSVKASLAGKTHTLETQLTVFETTATLTYEGFLKDKVSKSESVQSGDGPDAMWKLTFNHGGAFQETLSGLSLTDEFNNALWDTTPQNTVFLLGISEDEDATLLNAQDGSIALSTPHLKSYILFVNDFSDKITSGGNTVLKISLQSGRTLMLPFTLGPSLVVTDEKEMEGESLEYDFIGVFGSGHIQAKGDDPLALRSKGKIYIEGKVSANGTAGKDGDTDPGVGGLGGAGSSEGGAGGKGNGKDGKGLGAGKNKKLNDKPVGGGGGGYATKGGDGNGKGGGETYGTPELDPWVGGSGGAGGENYNKKSKGGGGGGGGGAIHLKAKGNLTILGSVLAQGGNGGQGSFGKNSDDSIDTSIQASGGGGGSGGAIWLESENGSVTVSESADVSIQGGKGGNLAGDGGLGRILIQPAL